MSERDAHLLAALRHAPDAELQAPAALRESILAQARQAVAPAPRAGLWQRLRATWPAPARWGASGAFATLLMAGVITLVWREETPGPVTEQSAPAATPAATPVPTPTPTPMAPAPATPPPASPAPRTASGEPEAPRRQGQKATPAQPPAPAAAQVAQERSRAERVAAAAPVQNAADGATAKTQPSSPLPAAAPLGETSAAAPATALRAPPRALRAVEHAGPELPQADDDAQWQPPQDDQPQAALWLRQRRDRVAGPWRPAPGATPAIGTPVVRWQRGGRAWVDTRAGRRWLLWCDEAGCRQAPLNEETPR